VKQADPSRAVVGPDQFGGKLSSANIKFIAATADQEPILANLLELYAYDFSEFVDVDLKADGKFSCFPGLSAYWCEPDRYPFLTRVDGNLAGLVLLKRGSEFSGREAVWDMDEFFVVRRYRRRGIGTQMAHEVWRRFPGAWEIRVMEENAKACEFWDRAISQFTGEAVRPVKVEKGGKGWALFSFESRPAE
jgi:predicted acetyltransferase